MRTLGLSFLIGILYCISITAQVKIGENPQTIDPAAVLELESTTMALIITRVTTEQMEAITPGPGAIVYNTDAQCVHYFNGTEWINLCEGANVNISTDAIVNQVSTIVLTETATGNNLEVAPNSIRTEQIVDGGIFGDDINDNSIGANKLARNSVTKIALSENAVGPFAIDRDSLPLSFFINDVPFLTAGDLSVTVSEDTGNALTIGSDDGAFYDEQPVLDAIAVNATAIANDLDGNPENEVQNLSLTGNLLTLSNPAGADDEIDLAGFAGTPDATDELITNAVLAGTDLIITEGGNDTTVPLAGIVSTQVVDGTTLTGLGTAANPFKIEPSVTNGQFLTTNATGNVVWASVPTGSGTVTTDGITIIGDGATTALSVPDAGITPIKIEPSATFGEVLTTDAAGNVVWETVATGGGTDDQEANEVPYDNATSLLTATDTQAAIDELAAAGGTDDQEANEVPYDNATSLLTATDTQAAIDELAAAGGTDDQVASEVPYDNTTSLLTATDAQAAIDELAAAGGTDDQNDSEVPLLTPTDFDGDLTDETTVQEALNALDVNSTDDQNDSEVPLLTPTDFDGDLTDETTVQEALNAIAGSSSDNQNIAGSVLTGQTLTIGIQNGTNQNVDLSDFALETEMNAAITASAALDNDKSNTNEIQTISSPSGLIAVTSVGNNYELTIAPNSITQGEIDNNAIGTGEIQANAVTSNEINNGSIVNADVSGTAAIAGSKINPDFGGQGIVTTAGLSVGADIMLNGNDLVPDYVFQKYYSGHSILKENYDFPSLKEIEAFVKQHNHLPGIQSAKEVRENGFWNLSESNLKNLEKIEELYLHTIEQAKEIEELKSENQSLTTDLKSLKRDIEQIKLFLQKGIEPKQ